MDQTPTQRLQQELSEYREAAAARRARAFVRDCPERVLGLPILPITPATMTMLHATGSRFLTTQTPLEGDVRNFLWFHSPLFRWSKHLPTFSKWAALFLFNAILHRRKDANYYAAVLALAITDIQAILADALADVPQAGGKRGASPAACVEAQFIVLMGRELQWSEDRVRHTPLARLLQFGRAMGGSDAEDAGERAIRFAHLRRRNEELRPERERKEREAAAKLSTVTETLP